MAYDTGSTIGAEYREFVVYKSGDIILSVGPNCSGGGCNGCASSGGCGGGGRTLADLSLIRRKILER